MSHFEYLCLAAGEQASIGVIEVAHAAEAALLGDVGPAGAWV